MGPRNMKFITSSYYLLKVEAAGGHAPLDPLLYYIIIEDMINQLMGMGVFALHVNLKRAPFTNYSPQVSKFIKNNHY